MWVNRIDKRGLRQCAKLQDLVGGDCCDYCCSRGKQSPILLRRIHTKRKMGIGIKIEIQYGVVVVFWDSRYILKILISPR